MAEESNEILGLGILDVKNEKLCAIYIHPNHSGIGIGRKLLSELEKIASDKGLKYLKLSSTINAFGFYKHHGYIEQGKSLHELPNGTKLECIDMHKCLTSHST